MPFHDGTSPGSMLSLGALKKNKVSINRAIACANKKAISLSIPLNDLTGFTTRSIEGPLKKHEDRGFLSNGFQLS